MVDWDTLVMKILPKEKELIIENENDKENTRK